MIGSYGTRASVDFSLAPPDPAVRRKRKKGSN